MSKTEETKPKADEPSTSIAASPGVTPLPGDKPETAPIATYSTIRPSSQKPAAETGGVIVAKALAGQLGSAPIFLVDMQIDERKLAVLDELVVTALAHFDFRAQIDHIRYWAWICDGERVGSQGVNGIGRRHILQAIANASGSQTVEKAEKPNVIARNLWNRGWKQKAEDQGKITEE